MKYSSFLPTALFMACAGATSVPGTPTPYLGSRPEDKVVLRDFSQVTAIAASFDRVFIAYPSGLAIWRPLERRWDAPRTPPDLQLMRDVFSAVVDPLDQTLWLTARHGWYHYSPTIDRWESSRLPEEVLAIGTDPVAPLRGIWLRTSAGWMLQPRIGGLPVRATPTGAPLVAATIDEALRDLPAIQVYRQQMLLGPRMQIGQFTAAAQSADRRGWYLGTSNRGAVFVDRVAGQPEPLTMGIRGEVVGAIAALRGGLWVATDADVQHLAALSDLSADLSRSTAFEGPRATGLPFAAVRQILQYGTRVWLATDQGVIRIDPSSGRLDVWNEGHGLADRRTLSLGRIGEQIFAGGERGLVEIDSGGTAKRRGSTFQQPVYALASRGDTLWIGSAIGLFLLLPGQDEFLQLNGLQRTLAIRTPILGIGYVADTLVAMTENQLIWRDPVSQAWSAGPDLSNQIGPLTAFSIERGVIWIGGERGAGSAQLNSPLLRPLLVPGDLPARVTAIAAQDEWLWVGTLNGLVRLRLSGR